MAITEVQHATSVVYTGPTVIATFGVAPTTGNLLVGAIFTRSDSGYTPPIGYTVAKDEVNVTASDTVGICYRIAAGDTTDVIFFKDTDVPAVVAIWEFSGTSATPLDKTASTAVTTGTSLAAGTTGVLSQADEVVIAAIGIRDAANDPSSYDSPFTKVDMLTNNSAWALLTTTLVVSATTSLTPTGHWTGSAAAMGVVATFKASASAGSTIPIFQNNYQR